MISIPKAPSDYQQIYHALQTHRVVSIIGIEKNVGKTTTLNYIIKAGWHKQKLGLSSIGRDGETIDEVFEHPKPRIYIPAGTIVATAKNSLNVSDISREILFTTHIHTPIGSIIIARALSDGFVELAGPSINADMQQVTQLLFEFGADQVIIDGAINRKTFATPTLADGTILVVGANISPNFQEFLEFTEFTVSLLSTPMEQNPKISAFAQKCHTIGYILPDGETRTTNLTSSLSLNQTSIGTLPSNITHLILNGVITDESLQLLFQYFDIHRPFIVLIPDATKIFLSSQQYAILQQSPWQLRVIHPITLLGISANPYSPMGYHYDQLEMLTQLRHRLSIPIIDVVTGG